MRVDKILQTAAHGAVILGLVLFSLSFVVAAAPASHAQSGPVVINEIRIDQPSTDNDEYFELTGPAGTPLDDVFYIVIGDGTDGSGVVECVVDLSGYTIPADGYFVVAEDTFTLGGADVLLAPNALNFENSDNVTHLLVYSTTVSTGDDLDADNDCTLDSTPWVTEYDRIALVLQDNPPSTTECHYGPPQIGPDGSYVPGHVYRCSQGGTPYGWWIGVFDPLGATDTPGAANYQCDPTAVDVAAFTATPGAFAVTPLMAFGLALMGSGGFYLAWRRRR